MWLEQGWIIVCDAMGSLYKRGTCFRMVYVDDFFCSGPELQARMYLLQVGEAIALEEIEVTNGILGIT